MSLITEKVTIDMLRQGVPFYYSDPLVNHDALPDYNTDNCTAPGDTEVFVIYGDWQKNPFIKKECFITMKGINPAVSGLINSIPGGGI